MSEQFLKHENIGSNVADSFLKTFVEHSSEIYVKQFLIYNVHLLLHLKEDVDRFGPLDNFSCFPFENHLNQIKHLIKSPTNPLQQVYRRIKEINNCSNNIQKLPEIL